MKKKFRDLLIIDLACFALSAVAIMLISLAGKMTGAAESVFSFVVALLFWAGIIAGIVMYRVIASKVKALEEKVTGLKKKAYQKLPGILTFRIDKFRIALYSAIGVGVLLIISDAIFHYVNEGVMFVVIALTYYLIAVHCIVNSKCFNVFSMMKSNVKK